MKTERKRQRQKRICPSCAAKALVIHEYATKVIRCAKCGWTKGIRKSRPFAG